MVTVELAGRFGNQLFMYAFARAYAERHGAEFQVDPWIGSRIFELDDPPITRRDLPSRNELTVRDGETDVRFQTYAQRQDCLIYTRSQVRSWLVIRSEFAAVLDEQVEPWPLAAHRRVGDYVTCGYPVVSEAAYRNACVEHGLPLSDLRFVTEEAPLRLPAFDNWAPFLPDFHRLMRAGVLLRGNSTFSWWAATLGNPARVFSPVVDGLYAGEHDCVFREDNAARFCSLDNVTDLALR